MCHHHQSDAMTMDVFQHKHALEMILIRCCAAAPEIGVEEPRVARARAAGSDPMKTESCRHRSALRNSMRPVR